MESIKQINGYISNGYTELEENENHSEACNNWLSAWDLIKGLDIEKVKSIEELNSKNEFYDDLSNWVQDLEMELENAALDCKGFFQKRITYCDEFCKLFPWSDNFIIMSMRCAEAESYFEIGNKELTEEKFEDIIKTYTGSVWPYIKWGDCYWLANIIREDKSLLDLNKAKEIYSSALNVKSTDVYIVKERLEELEDIIKRMTK